MSFPQVHGESVIVFVNCVQTISIMWLQWIAMIGVLIMVCLGLTALYGRYRWQSGTAKLRAKLISGRQTIKPKIYSQKEIEGLPAPVQRFFQTVLKEGQPIVALEGEVGWEHPEGTRLCFKGKTTDISYEFAS